MKHARYTTFEEKEKDNTNVSNYSANERMTFHAPSTHTLSLSHAFYSHDLGRLIHKALDHMYGVGASEWIWTGQKNPKERCNPGWTRLFHYVCDFKNFGKK